MSDDKLNDKDEFNDFDDEVKKILARDPLDEVEKGQHLWLDPLLDQQPPPQEGPLDDVDSFGPGAHQPAWTPEEYLAHGFKVNALKKAAMIVTGDTTFSNKVDRYLAIAKEIGFKTVLELPFTVKAVYDEQPRNEKLFVLWRDGILLAFDTFDGDHVNGGHFYYNWLANQRGDRHGATSSGSYVLPLGKKWQEVENDNLVWAGDHDCREALKFNIRQLEKHGKFLPKWVERPHLWLLHHGDTNGKHWPELKSDEINAERIALLPLEVREAITPKEAP